MNILFIYSRKDYYSPSKPLENPDQIQFGISYISALLKKYGHKIKLLVLTKESDKEKIDKYIGEFSPRLICFSSVFTEYDLIADSARYIKERYPNIYLVAGGAHISLSPQDCINDAFDALCIGEGEYPILELTEALSAGHKPTGILNLWIKHADSLEKNPTRPFLEEIDSLPFPDRKIWDEWIANPEGRASLLASRGCPFQCAYCCNHALRKIAAGPYLRFRSVQNVLDEIKGIIHDYPAAKEIFFEAETIVLNREFSLELAEKLFQLNLSLKKPLSFGAIMRVVPNMEIEDIFAVFKKANFRFMNIGLESGSQRIRADVLRRHYSNEDIKKAVSLARKHGLQVCFYNLIGLPEESADDMRQTIAINRACQPDWHFLSIFFPYPGTDLYLFCKEKGLIGELLDREMERSKVVLNFPKTVKKQVMHNYIWFDYYVYHGHRPIHKILARVLVSKLKTAYRTNLIYKKLINLKLFKLLRELLRK